MYFGLTPVSSKSAEEDYEKFKKEIEIYGVGLWDNNVYNTLKENDYLGFIEKKNGSHVIFYKIQKIMNKELNEEIRKRNEWQINEKSLKRSILRLEAVNHKPCYWCEKSKLKLNYVSEYVIQGTTRLTAFGDQTLETMEEKMA